MTSRTIAACAIGTLVLLALAARAQNAPAAQQYLDRARQSLDAIPADAVTGDSAAKMQQLRNDFNLVARRFAETTSSTASTTQMENLLAAVRRDLRALIGTRAEPSPSAAAMPSPPPTAVVGTKGIAPDTGVVTLDAVVRGQLQTVRDDLDRFQTAATGASPATPPAATAPCTVGPSSSVPALLERIEQVVDQAIAKSHGSARTVTIDRSNLDEIHAEIEELKTAIGR